ncbi:MAG: hypothetical protein KatS3mg097_011 [Candidatus Parcubacteria bacterium]|nr:MAG: hypothetical protein KatS3mg097_011 [Candidatus Parcubacteria bacterium]
MPKLPSIKSDVLLNFFYFQGFILDHITGSHYILYHPKIFKRAVIPYNKKDLPKGTVLAILRESGFSRKDLIEFLTKK